MGSLRPFDFPHLQPVDGLPDPVATALAEDGDALTGLPNRRLFKEELRSLTTIAAKEQVTFALLMIDLDRFKLINDTYGHDAGDALLVAAAVRLRAAVRVSHLLVRLGGDEFANLLGDLSDAAPGPHRLIELVCARIIEAFTDPVPFQGNDLTTSASVAIAICPECGLTPEAVFNAADLVLYEAKRAGRRTWRWHATVTGMATSLSDDSPGS